MLYYKVPFVFRPLVLIVFANIFNHWKSYLQGMKGKQCIIAALFQKRIL